MPVGRVARGLCLLGALLASGCEPAKRPALGTVTGTVTLDGRPLPDALVLFTPEGPGRTAQGRTDADGRYALVYLRDIAGATLGPHTVQIITADDEEAGAEPLPDRYHAKSELSAAVQPGGNAFDFDLSSR